MLMHFTFINPTESLQAAVDATQVMLSPLFAILVLRLYESFPSLGELFRIRHRTPGSQTMGDGTCRPVVVDQHHGALMADHRIVPCDQTFQASSR